MQFVRSAISEFNDIMCSTRKDVFENMHKRNKGELFVLGFLSMQDDAALPSDLSAGLCASNARISALLSSLEKKNQIERNIDKSNRRNILVSITDAGRERFEKEKIEMNTVLGKAFIDMGESNTNEMLKLLKMFMQTMQKHLEEYTKSLVR